MSRARVFDWKQKATTNEYRLSFWGEENVLELIIVLVAQLCECIKTIELYILNELIT